MAYFHAQSFRICYEAKFRETILVRSRMIWRKTKIMWRNEISYGKYKFWFEFRQNYSNWITLWLVIVVEWSNDRRIHARKHAHIHANRRRASKTRNTNLVVSQSYYVVRNFMHTHSNSHTLNAVYSTYRCVVLQVTLCIVRSKLVTCTH